MLITGIMLTKDDICNGNNAVCLHHIAQSQSPPSTHFININATNYLVALLFAAGDQQTNRQRKELQQQRESEILKLKQQTQQLGATSSGGKN
ncbi:unnamed protein product [Ceratitis capitata]|uniref:(Mediterranean fruit fly) hypothetical protein n=1 Tax=Ceratitis capitata TaxID=7213 RepID=A0A811V317_CERCA|nr:unnamed protein product [Ceratitis capitata]